MLKEAPAKARISVFAIVPMASRPMFIPERNSRPGVIWGSTSLSSAQAEEMDMATSMTAPSAAMRIPLTKSPCISKGLS